jgi:hypothetical protein
MLAGVDVLCLDVRNVTSIIHGYSKPLTVFSVSGAALRVRLYALVGP